MTTREILVKARKQIERPERWAGSTTDLINRRCECAVTAIAAVAPDDMERIVREAFHMPSFRLIEFNDSHSHAEVLAAFDKAIAECES